MQNFQIRNLPEAKAADEPIPIGVHSKHYTDAVISFSRELTGLESKIKAQLTDLESKISPDEKMQAVRFQKEKNRCNPRRRLRRR